MLEFEQEARAKGFQSICGVDEAGAGPLAGPVVAAAVILPFEDSSLAEHGLTDSKKMSEKKRDLLFDMICEKALSFAVAEVSSQEIDQTDILSARLKAMNLAIEGLSLQADFALIDGDRDKGQQCQIECPHQLIVKGDALSLSIAAASVLAKVHRDRYMLAQDEIYPQYAFAKHKGYGTKLHFEKIAQYKLCPIHRVTFLRKKWNELGLS
ncbi:MAG: ribonuclease HII [Eubacteriales bacterium]